MNDRQRLGMGRAECAHPGRCGSDGVGCVHSDCYWTTQRPPEGWPAQKPRFRAEQPRGRTINPWLVCAVVVVVVYCVATIYAAVS